MILDKRSTDTIYLTRVGDDLIKMRLKDLRIAMLAENGYEDLELWYPMLRLQEEGATVDVIGSGTSKVYKSKHGYPVRVDKDAVNVEASDYDALIVPGGWAPDQLRRHQSVISFVKDIFSQQKVVGAICHAGSLLVSADVLRGKTVTCFEAIKDDLINAGAEYVDREVVVDGNLVTSRQPKDLPAFCRETINTLAKRTTKAD